MLQAYSIKTCSTQQGTFSPLQFCPLSQASQLCIWFDKISSFVAPKPPQILGGNSTASSFSALSHHSEGYHQRLQLLPLSHHSEGYHWRLQLLPAEFFIRLNCLSSSWSIGKVKSSGLSPPGKRPRAQAELRPAQEWASLSIHCHFSKKKRLWCQSQSWHNKESSAFHEIKLISVSA